MPQIKSQDVAYLLISMGGGLREGDRRYTFLAMISPTESSHCNLFPERLIRENDLKVHYCHRQRG